MTSLGALQFYFENKILFHLEWQNAAEQRKTKFLASDN